MNQTELTLDDSILTQWIGKQEVRKDTIDLKTVNQLHATLDQDRAPYINGESLPLAWHWLYFNPMARASQLGRDGHPAVGGFMPPVALPRRMWAGTRISAHEPIQIGESLTRTSTIAKVARKSGSTGELCFVTVKHAIHGEDPEDLRLVDEHDIVYREEDSGEKPLKPPPPAPTDYDAERVVVPNTTMLFRYSAVTFNGHRIHYDLDFCRHIENYPGLVIHGPLTATWVLELASEYLSTSGKGQQIGEFSFRAVSPLFHDKPYAVRLKQTDAGLDLWAANPDGNLSMQCHAVLR